MDTNKPQINKKSSFFRDNYYLIVPILATILIYSISLTYGFRNFDEDTLIKNFCVNKPFGEYLEKLLLIYSNGITQSHGFAFSGIKNVHFSILCPPIRYLISFLFKGVPFLFHTWSLFLHLIALYFFIRLCHILTKNKQIAIFAGLLWSLHPINVEPIIWATNWACNMGASIYFFTLYKIASIIKNKFSSFKIILFIILLTIVQILLVEHTIMLPISIFILVLYELKSLRTALRISIPSFLIIIIYFIIRAIMTNNPTSSLPESSVINTLERVVYLPPQIFVHNLKLLFFPLKLTIDQLDLLTLDKTVLGTYNTSCIITFILFIVGAIALRNKLPYLSMGLIVYFFSILPFLQVIPLYSVVTERYNYFGSAFFVFGIVSALFKCFESKNKLTVTLLILLTVLASYRSYIRILDWKSSTTLFQSTVNTSKSLLKKGIWTYNLAISKEDENQKKELLKLSINLLDLYLNTPIEATNISTLKNYELDSKSLHAKAALRIGQMYEALKNSELQFKYLSKALELSTPKTHIISLIHKNLGTYYFQTGNFNKSLEYYKKSFSISNEPSTLYAIAVSYLKLKDYINYEKYLKQSVLETSDNNATAFKTYGQLLELQGDFNNAIKYYKLATLLENKVEPYVLLATLYLKLNRFNNAYKTIENGLYGFNNNPSLLYLQGSIYLSKNKIDLGIQDLIKAINSNEAQNDIKIAASQILIDIFLKKRDLEDAIKYNNLILSIDPSNTEALKNKKYTDDKIMR